MEGAPALKRFLWVWLAGLGGLVLAALSGWLFFLAMPLSPYGFLAWVCLVPGIVGQFLLAPRDWVARLYQAVAFVLGIGLTVLSGVPTDLVPASFPLWLPIGGALLVVGAFVFLVGLPTGNPSFHRRTAFRYLVIFPALTWIGFEFLRMLLQLGHIWGWLATSQWEYVPFLQLAALGGPWLLSLLIVAANYALALGLIALLSRRDRPIALRPALFSLGVVVLLVAAAYAWGALRSRPQAGVVRVAALQPGRELGDEPTYVLDWANRDWEKLSRDIIPGDMAVRTREAAALGARLVVWPEATIWLDPLDPQNDPYTRETLAALASETGTYIVVPYYILTPEGQLSWFLGFAPNQRNETLIVTPEGEFLGPYAKNHPIPFIGEVSSTAGKYPVQSLPFARVATMLGYDTAFTDTARRLTQGGAQLLTLSTHDWSAMSGTYGVHTRLRAVENGVAIVKCDWEVGSLITDPWGRVLAQAAMDRQEEKIVIADVPLRPAGGTLYTLVGDALGWIGLGSFVLLVLMRFFPYGLLRARRRASAT